MDMDYETAEETEVTVEETGGIQNEVDAAENFAEQAEEPDVIETVRTV